MDNQIYSKTDTKTSFGLVANGAAGAWHVDVDETLSGKHKWFLQIEGPAVYLNFQIEGPDAVDRLLTFIELRLAESSSAAPGELRVGQFGQTPVVFIWDPEGAGRGVVLIAGRGGSKMRVEMPHDDVDHFATALRQVRADLCAAGLCAAATE
jgi:hypothetical protein